MTGEGECKHIIATLLAWLHEPESFARVLAGGNALRFGVGRVVEQHGQDVAAQGRGCLRPRGAQGGRIVGRQAVGQLDQQIADGLFDSVDGNLANHHLKSNVQRPASSTVSAS